MQMSIYVANLFVGTPAGVFQTRGSPVEFTHSVACLLKYLLGCVRGYLASFTHTIYLSSLSEDLVVTIRIRLCKFPRCFRGSIDTNS